MKYTEIEEKLNKIELDIRNFRDQKNLKEFLRQKLSEVAEVLWDYSSPMLTKVKSRSGNTDQKNKKPAGGSTNLFSYVNNCPKDKQGAPDFSGLGKFGPNFNIDAFRPGDLPELNEQIRRHMDVNR